MPTDMFDDNDYAQLPQPRIKNYFEDTPASKPRSNPHGKLICCFGCGRDTRAVSGYCKNCIGDSYTQPEQALPPEVTYHGDDIEQNFPDLDTKDEL